MDLLQGFHFPVAMQLHVVDALGGCPGGSHGGHIRNLGLDGGFPQVAVVIHAVLSGRRVDDQVNVAVGDQIQDIGASLVELLHLFGLDAGLGDQVVGTSGSQDLEAALCEQGSNFHNLRFVLAVDGDQHRSA